MARYSKAMLRCQHIELCAREREIWPAEIHLSDYGVTLEGHGPQWEALKTDLLDAAAGSGRSVWQVVTLAVRSYLDAAKNQRTWIRDNPTEEDSSLRDAEPDGSG